MSVPQFAPAETALAIVVITAALLGVSVTAANVSIAATPRPLCRRHDPRPSIPPNAWAAPRRVLAPRGPIAATVCDYTGSRLSSGVRLTSAEMHRIVTDLGALRPDTPKERHEFRSCFFAQPSPTFIWLTYPQDKRVEIGFNVDGCSTVTNGNLTRDESARAVGRLVADLARIASPHRRGPSRPRR